MFNVAAHHHSLSTLIITVLTPLTLAVGLTARTADAQQQQQGISCADDLSPRGLTAYFASDRAPLHADYQRVLPLPDGRTLWTFQDAMVQRRGGGSSLIHNAGLVQTGNCFELLRGGTAAEPQPWLFADATEPFHHWFWPLGAALAADGNIRIIVAEMRLHGDRYLIDRTEPMATWIASIRATDLQVLAVQPAADASASLYGWSITSDSRWTYLYAWCYRQFGWQPGFGYDADCTADVRVGRVARGHLDDRPTYWDGEQWQTDPSAAVPVIPSNGRAVNPAQVQWDGSRFVAVTKVGDWWGDSIVLDVAGSAQGPWRTVSTVRVDTKCDSCNTYFASFVPTGSSHTTPVVAISNNSWVDPLSRFYVPSFLTVTAPQPSSWMPHRAMVLR